MNLTLYRNYYDKYTSGNLVHDANLLMHTLELPWSRNLNNISCIPEGIYPVIKQLANKERRYNYFRLPTVPGRSGILIHIGNYTKEIKGCILVGASLTDLDKDGLMDVAFSTTALSYLWNYTPDIFTLTIKSK